MNLSLSKFFIVVAMTALLAACGGRSAVVTQDDSADYRGAQTLPPLKKPGSQRPKPAVEPSEAVATQTSATPSVPPSVAVSPVQESKLSSTAQASADSGESASLAPQSLGVVSARVVKKKNGQALLEIDGNYETAWAYLRGNLKKSDITVHTRNKAAGRFSLGCAGLDQEGTVEVTKKGGWSVFRRSVKEQEHCALQVLADKNVTRVTAYSRSGEPVDTQLAQSLFNRLLNN